MSNDLLQEINYYLDEGAGYLDAPHLGAQALDLRNPERVGAGTAFAHARVREVVPFLGEGEPLAPDLEPVRALIRGRRLEA